MPGPVSTNPDDYTGGYPGGGVPLGALLRDRLALRSGGSYQGSTFVPDVHTVTVDEANAQFLTDSGLQQEWSDEAVRLGILPATHSFDEALAVWQKYVTQANLVFSATQGQKSVTPFELMQAQAGAIGGLGSTKTDRTVTTSRLDQGTVENSIRSLFQEQMGRDPTANELQRYSRLAISGAAAHPQVVDTTVKTDAAGNQVTNRNVIDTGYSAEMLQADARKLTSDDPEHGVYQAAGHFLPLLESLLGAPG